ncbi:hypothetical protein ANCCEY_07500 [Ancylostoma ceylanicum]|uniref:Uncharacterized protein n=1 Tax=Ancylostoma ceylanicum TaxID=53326 RepID=A0A0D6LNK9_9BILA|nr:hypothetical protein ANCCEY_07500 [Ancylostoma ceylanicum]
MPNHINSDSWRIRRARLIATVQYRVPETKQQMTDVKAFLYEICIPLIGILCVLAAVLNIAVFLSRFHVKSRSATLELTYSLALSDTWTSLVIAISLCWNSYMPVVLQIHHTTFCFPLTLEALVMEVIVVLEKMRIDCLAWIASNRSEKLRLK